MTLPARADAKGFQLWLEANLRGGDVTREHSTLHLYADDPRAVRYVEGVVTRLCEELETPAEVVVERWNPGRREWQAPGLPIEDATDPEGRPDPYTIDFDGSRYEVVLSSPTRLSETLVHRLQRELPVFRLGERRLWATAVDIQEAHDLADRARGELPTGTQLRVRPLTRRRRWWRKQQLLGSYASGGDVGGG